MILISLALATTTPVGPTLNYPKAESVACEQSDTADGLDCRANQAAKAGRFGESAGLFEQAAALLPPARRDEALAAAGNMWIAANDAEHAAVALDKALAGETLSGIPLGQAQLDRARAAEESGDLKTARSMVTKATATISKDPFLWYFSSALAIREGNIPLARSTINRALSIAPDSPEVLFEAGHVSHAAGEDGDARRYWEKALAADPNGPTGKAARDALGMMDVPLTITNEVAKQPNGDGEGPADPEE